MWILVKCNKYLKSRPNRSFQFSVLFRCQFLPNDLLIKCNPNQNPSKVFVEIARLILKFVWKCTGPRKAKTILKKKNKVGGLILSDFKTYYNANNQDSVLLAWGQTYRRTEQSRGSKNRLMHTHTYVYLWSIRQD